MKITLQKVREIIKEELIRESLDQAKNFAQQAIDGDKDAALVLVDLLQEIGDPRGKKLQSPSFFERFKALLSFVNARVQRNIKSEHFYIANWPQPGTNIGCSMNSIFSARARSDFWRNRPGFDPTFTWSANDSREMALFHQNFVFLKNGDFYSSHSSNDSPLGNVFSENNSELEFSSDDFKRALIEGNELESQTLKLLEMVRFLGETVQSRKRTRKPKA